MSPSNHPASGRFIPSVPLKANVRLDFGRPAGVIVIVHGPEAMTSMSLWRPFSMKLLPSDGPSAFTIRPLLVVKMKFESPPSGADHVTVESLASRNGGSFWPSTPRRTIAARDSTR